MREVDEFSISVTRGEQGEEPVDGFYFPGTWVDVSAEERDSFFEAVRRGDPEEDPPMYVFESRVTQRNWGASASNEILNLFLQINPAQTLFDAISVGAAGVLLAKWRQRCRRMLSTASQEWQAEARYAVTAIFPARSADRMRVIGREVASSGRTLNVTFKDEDGTIFRVTMEDAGMSYVWRSVEFTESDETEESGNGD